MGEINCVDTHYSALAPHTLVEQLTALDRAETRLVGTPDEVTSTARRQPTLCEIYVSIKSLVDSGATCPECAARLKAYVADAAEDEREFGQLAREWDYARDRGKQWLAHQWEGSN